MALWNQDGRWRNPAIAVTSLVLLLGSGYALFRPEPPLATLDGQVISRGDFESYLKSAYPIAQVRTFHEDATARAQAFQAYLDSRVVAAKARKLGIDREQRFTKALELMEMKLLAGAVTERYRTQILKSLDISPDAVLTHYEQHPNEFLERPRFTIRQVLIYVKGNPAFPEQGLDDASARARAKAALSRLRAKEDWDEVARIYSDDAATKQHGGLIRDGAFGFFAPEVERAIRAQELGEPGEPIRSQFGYHVLQVESRILEGARQPFEQVKGNLTERLKQQRSAEARHALMAPFWEELGFKIADAGKRDANLLDESAVAPTEVLAEIAGRKVLESDFRWFLKDALIASQRQNAYARPGARQDMLSAFLDMLVLEAKARSLGLHQTAEFVISRTEAEQNLKFEFVQQRERIGPFGSRELSEQELAAEQKAYLERLRVEAQLRIAKVAR